MCIRDSAVGVVPAIAPSAAVGQGACACKRSGEAHFLGPVVPADVYKRQALQNGFQPRKAGAFRSQATEPQNHRAPASGTSRVTSIPRFRGIPPSTGWWAATTRTVSYTHLDVYKRQPYESLRQRSWSSWRSSWRRSLSKHNSRRR